MAAATRGWEAGRLGAGGEGRRGRTLAGASCLASGDGVSAAFSSAPETPGCSPTATSTSPVPTVWKRVLGLGLPSLAPGLSRHLWVSLSAPDCGDLSSCLQS